VPGRVCRDGHGEHPGDGRPDDDQPEAVAEARGERVAVRDPHERPVGGTHAGQTLLLLPVDDELRRGLQQLDEL
jgi:hypothetical protein